MVRDSQFANKSRITIRKSSTIHESRIAKSQNLLSPLLAEVLNLEFLHVLVVFAKCGRKDM